MRKTMLFAVLAGLLPFSAAVSSAFAPPEAASSALPAAQDAQPAVDAPARREPRGRLPNNFTKLGITESQREKIYGIQSKYEDRLAALRAQMREVVAQRDAEVETALTPEQRAELKKLQDEAAARRAAAAAARDAASTPKPVPTQE